MSIAIRKATPDDREAIAVLHAATHRATYEPLIAGRYDAPSLDRRRAEWLAMLAGPGFSFVALDAADVIGFCHADGDRIEPLHVDAAYHRRGIGAALLRRVLATLHDRGVRQAVFNVFAGNARAIAFYEACGAVRLETRRMDDAPVPYLDYVYRLDTTPR